MDRVSYLLQEIYGIENKNNQETKVCPCGQLTELQAGNMPQVSTYLLEGTSLVMCGDFTGLTQFPQGLMGKMPFPGGPEPRVHHFPLISF